MPKLAGSARLILDAKRTAQKTANTVDLDVVALDDTVLHALRVMVERNIRAVLVLDGDRLAGILTEHDYAREVELKGRTAGETRVREIMTADLVTVGPDDSIEQCNLLLHRHRIHHLPVVEDGRVLGMLSAHDVLEELVVEEEEQIHGLETERLMIRTGNY
jgi:CBS domain-containing protein